MAEWMDLTGKVIIVTGGSRGIGEHVFKILRRNNATVIVADLTPNPDYESDENILFINNFFHHCIYTVFFRNIAIDK